MLYECKLCCQDNDIPDNCDRETCSTYESYQQGRADEKQNAINEVKSSLAQVYYEYDDNMSIDNNIGSAMLKQFGDGYEKGIADEQLHSIENAKQIQHDCILAIDKARADERERIIKALESQKATEEDDSLAESVSTAIWNKAISRAIGIVKRGGENE